VRGKEKVLNPKSNERKGVYGTVGSRARRGDECGNHSYSRKEEGRGKGGGCWDESAIAKKRSERVEDAKRKVPPEPALNCLRRGEEGRKSEKREGLW